MKLNEPEDIGPPDEMSGDVMIRFTRAELENLASAIEGNMNPIVPNLEIYLLASNKIAKALHKLQEDDV